MRTSGSRFARLHPIRGRSAPAVAAIVAVAAASLFAASCGGAGAPPVASVNSSTLNGAGSSGAASRTHALLLVGRCLRQHGLNNLPDPTVISSGPDKGQPVLDKRVLRSFPTSIVNDAVSACHNVIDRAGMRLGPQTGPSTDASPQTIQHLLDLTHCMRHHGLRNFPDPARQGVFNFAGTGIDPHAPHVLSILRTCLPTAHGSNPQIGTP